MVVLAEASRYFIIGKESLCIHTISVTWYHFHQKVCIKHTNIMKCLASSLAGICTSAFPSFCDTARKIIQSLFWALQ